jgi:rhodanese-related sulfurtransferase
MPTRIELEEVERLRRRGDAQLVEVLPPEAFAELHLPGAVNIPLEDLRHETTRVLDRAEPIIVYCYDYQ